ncbi:MAG: hypothetical protein WCQ50_17305 [Spirochaetota bacterium]
MLQWKASIGNSGWQNQVYELLSENGLFASTGFFADLEAGKLIVRRMISPM